MNLVREPSLLLDKIEYLQVANEGIKTQVPFKFWLLEFNARNTNIEYVSNKRTLATLEL